MISLTYDWERAYIDAILETDDEKLTKRIDAAEAKLLARINEFAREYGPNEKPDPAFQLRLLWEYTVNLKAENLRLSR